MQKHYVDFYSPGTFTAEVTRREISSWSTGDAVGMAGSITERYGARPYGFRFITRARSDDDLDAKDIAISPMHYIGGVIETLAEIEARNDPSDRTLIANMRINGYDRVIRNENSWRWTQPLQENDIVLDVALPEGAP